MPPALPNHKAENPIAIFDSGVGGLTITRAVRALLPGEDILYLGDQANVPYGPRGLDEVRRLSEAIVQFLREQGAKLVVVACNTASAAALKALRAAHPEISFVGMEPAVKPAAEQSVTGVVGVLATPATFEGLLYASVVERFAQGATLLQSTCPGLVDEIEAGRPNGSEAQRILREALEPMLAQNLDTVVLGCTHYPFTFDTIRSIVGPDVRLIDPAPAIARRVEQLLSEQDLRNPRGSGGQVRYFTSGHAIEVAERMRQLLEENAQVEQVNWVGGELRV